MAAEEHEFTLPGADLPPPDGQLRKRPRAVVTEHTVAEGARDTDAVIATFGRGGVYRVIPSEASPPTGEEAIRKGGFAELQKAFPVVKAQLRAEQETDRRGIPEPRHGRLRPSARPTPAKPARPSWPVK